MSEHPDFIGNDHPRDGELSVTSMGKLNGPLEPVVDDKPEPDRRGSLATPLLGPHVME